MVRSDLPRFPNPAAAICLNAATEPDFDPRDRPDQPASAAATPRYGLSRVCLDRPRVSLHPHRDRPEAKDLQDGLQSLPSVAAPLRLIPVFLVFPSSRAPRRSAAKVQPSAVTTTFTLMGDAIREDKGIVEGMVVRSPPWRGHARQRGANAIVGP